MDSAYCQYRPRLKIGADLVLLPWVTTDIGDGLEGDIPERAGGPPSEDRPAEDNRNLVPGRRKREDFIKKRLDFSLICFNSM